MQKKEKKRMKEWRKPKGFMRHQILWVPEGEEREKGTENVFEESMAENFPNLKKETDIQVQEWQESCK